MTENKFKSLLPCQLHTDSLLDRNILIIIYSFNNFSNDINHGFAGFN